MFENSKKSAVIIGAGPAGLSAALGLLRSNIGVTILEQRQKWTGRVCGSFLSPESTQHLRWLGLLETVLENGAVPIQTIRVTYQQHEKILRKKDSSENHGLAFPRKNLEGILTEAVLKKGGEIRLGARATQTQHTHNHWQTLINNKEQITSNILIQSDGRFSMTHEKPASSKGWYGWNALFEGVDQNSGEMSLHLFHKGYVGVLTFSDGHTNVCGLSYFDSSEDKNWKKNFETALEKSPLFKKEIAGSERVSDWQGVGPLPFSMWDPSLNNKILVGDAAAVGDPMMGEGIARALAAGPMIFSSLECLEQSPASFYSLYQKEWRKIYRPRLRTGSWARKIIKSNWLLNLIAPTLLKSPTFLPWATNYFHVGYNTPSIFNLERRTT